MAVAVGCRGRRGRLVRARLGAVLAMATVFALAGGAAVGHARRNVAVRCGVPADTVSFRGLRLASPIGTVLLEFDTFRRPSGSRHIVYTTVGGDIRLTLGLDFR